ncbi:sulfatase-like hydrolase/transferase [bacterium]|nr:sulfatase-like hydrolase/transferase [bacterium]
MLSNQLIKQVVGVCLLSMLAVGEVALGANAKEGKKAPNLVFILADDLGWSDTTLYGTTSFYETPNIERLAKRGMLFSNAYTAHPLCSPTRCSIMTGLEPGRTGFTSAAGHTTKVVLKKEYSKPRSDQKVIGPQSVSRLDPKYITLAESIKDAGYATGHFGKWHLGEEPYSPLEHGFDVDVPHYPGPGPAGSYVAPWRFPDKLDFDPTVPNEHIEDRMANEACVFIEKHKHEPFFLNYWAFSVHGPWDGKKSLIKKYSTKADPKNPQRLPVYGAMVESLDDAVGQLLDTLDRLKLSDNTIIVFFSDNGGNMYSRVDGLPPTSNAPLRGGKATIYEGGTRVPCAVVWPGKVKAGSQTDVLLSSVDWYPTLMHMMEIKLPKGAKFDGVSQVPALLGTAAPRSSLVCFVPNYYPKPETIPSTYLRRGPWKLIRFHGDGKMGEDRMELYRLDQDIGETKNLASSQVGRVKKMNAEITRHLKRIGAMVPKTNPNYKGSDAISPAKKSSNGSPEVLFLDKDKNRNGLVSLKEYIGNPKNRNVPALSKQFTRRDLNRDGKLTLQEFKGVKN